MSDKINIDQFDKQISCICMLIWMYADFLSKKICVRGGGRKLMQISLWKFSAIFIISLRI